MKQYKILVVDNATKGERDLNALAQEGYKVIHIASNEQNDWIYLERTVKDQVVEDEHGTIADKLQYLQ